MEGAVGAEDGQGAGVDGDDLRQGVQELLGLEEAFGFGLAEGDGDLAGAALGVVLGAVELDPVGKEGAGLGGGERDEADARGTIGLGD